MRKIEKLLLRNPSLPENGKNFHGARKRPLAQQCRLFQVYRKTTRSFRSIYSGFTTLLRTLGERGFNPMKTYAYARMIWRPAEENFYDFTVTELEAFFTRSRRSRKERIPTCSWTRNRLWQEVCDQLFRTKNSYLVFLYMRDEDLWNIIMSDFRNARSSTILFLLKFYWKYHNWNMQLFTNEIF